MSSPSTIKVICQNRKAHHDYELGKSIEAGLVLTGDEVKSLRQGHCHLQDAFADFKNGVLMLHRAHIQAYQHATHCTPEPERARICLVHKTEARKLERELKLKGMTLVPLKIYFKGPYAKVEIAVGKGRKRHDKRDALREREMGRDLRRVKVFQ